MKIKRGTARVENVRGSVLLGWRCTRYLYIHKQARRRAFCTRNKIIARAQRLFPLSINMTKAECADHPARPVPVNYYRVPAGDGVSLKTRPRPILTKNRLRHLIRYPVAEKFRARAKTWRAYRRVHSVLFRSIPPVPRPRATHPPRRK